MPPGVKPRNNQALDWVKHGCEVFNSIDDMRVKVLAANAASAQDNLSRLCDKKNEIHQSQGWLHRYTIFSGDKEAVNDHRLKPDRSAIRPTPVAGFCR